MKGKVIFVLMLLSVTLFGQRNMEKLGRGVVAIKDGSKVFVSWRILGDEFPDVSYNIYRGETKLNSTPITGASNYTDNSPNDEKYSVSAIIEGVEQEKSESVDAWSTIYKSVPISAPPGGTTPADDAYTYSAGDASVGDLDGDGEYEIILKWDPSNAKDNAQGGYTGNVILEGIKMDGTSLWEIDLGVNIRAGAHYTQFMVYDFDGDGISEIACKTAPGTIDGEGNFLSTGPAESDNDAADYRNGGGYILSGPEYLSIFNGETGAELSTVYYTPRRHPDTENPTPAQLISEWGDGYGNRVDRFLAGVAYLDGTNPSLVMCRGYYSRTVAAAFDWDGTELTSRWVFDTEEGYPGYAGQGNHNLSVGDVDNDGKDEIVYGSCAIDDDGTGLHNTMFGHGDASHLSDLDPTRPGMEFVMPHEHANGTTIPGLSFRDATTGEVLWSVPTSGDVGRGISADIDPNHLGCESWGSIWGGIRNCKGEIISLSHPTTAGGDGTFNMAIWWDGDLTRELIDRTVMTKYNWNTSGTDRVMTIYNYGATAVNGTKSNPCIYADMFGDWREEMIWKHYENDKLLIFSTTRETSHKIYTLMHDPTYRLSVAWQNVGYNQPTQTGFYLGHGMDQAPIPPMLDANCRWIGGSSGNVWDTNTTANWKVGKAAGVFLNSDEVMFDILGEEQTNISLVDTVSPGAIKVISKADYDITGTGKITGQGNLLKSGFGSLTLNVDADYTGSTKVYQGALIINKSLSGSTVLVENKAEIGGAGSIAQPITFANGAAISPGFDFSSADTLTIDNSLTLNGGVTCKFDLSDDTTGINKENDHILVNGDLIISGTNTLKINYLNEKLGTGTYELITYTGSLTGDISNIEVVGVFGQLHTLSDDNGTINLYIHESRNPGSVVWSGTGNVWDMLVSPNWLLDNQSDVFAFYDTVFFNSIGENNPVVNIQEELHTSGVNVDVSSNNYTFNGTGGLFGDANLNVEGSGKFSLLTKNGYTGVTSVSLSTLEVNLLDDAGNESSIGASLSTDASQIALNNSTLRYIADNDQSTNRGITLTGSDTIDIVNSGNSLLLNGLIAGTGALVKNGAGELILKGQNNTYSGGFTLLNGTLTFSDDIANSRGPGLGDLILKGGTLNMFDNGSANSIYWNIIVPDGSITRINSDRTCKLYGALTGNGSLTFSTPDEETELKGDWSEFTGMINVISDADGGDFRVGNSFGYDSASIYLSNNVTAYHDDEGLVAIGELTGSVTSSLTKGLWEIGAKNTDFEYNGVIKGNSLYKVGTGTLTLTNANTYTGSTQVKGGKLLANSTTGCATGTSTVRVQLNGILGGDGIINGETRVYEGGTIDPGTNVGTLTVNNNLTFREGSMLVIDIDKSLGANDTLVLLEPWRLTIDGNLSLNILNDSTFKAGDEFTILSSSNITGEFMNITPSSPGSDLLWNFDSLYTTGTIKVESEPGSGLDVTKNVLLESIEIYPNPTSGTLNIEIDPSLQKVEFTIVSLPGDELHTQTAISGSNEIDVSRLNPGMYLLKVSCGDSTAIKSFVKK